MEEATRRPISAAQEPNTRCCRREGHGPLTHEPGARFSRTRALQTIVVGVVAEVELHSLQLVDVVGFENVV